MKILEIISSLLNSNKCALASANYGAKLNYKDNKKINGNVTAFWQPSFDNNSRRESLKPQLSQPTQHAPNNEEAMYPCDIIRHARKLAKKITKVAQESPKSLNHYLSKEDLEKLELLQEDIATAMIAIKTVQLPSKKNSNSIKDKQ